MANALRQTSAVSWKDSIEEEEETRPDSSDSLEETDPVEMETEIDAYSDDDIIGRSNLSPVPPDGSANQPPIGDIDDLTPARPVKSSPEIAFKDLSSGTAEISKGSDGLYDTAIITPPPSSTNVPNLRRATSNRYIKLPRKSIHSSPFEPLLPPEATIKDQQCIAILTSGGDAPGMNAALRSCVATCLVKRARVFSVTNGYHGLVYGGDNIKEIGWPDITDIMHKGGTVFGSARCLEMRKASLGRARLGKLASTGLAWARPVALSSPSSLIAHSAIVVAEVVRVVLHATVTAAIVAIADWIARVHVWACDSCCAFAHGLLLIARAPARAPEVTLTAIAFITTAAATICDSVAAVHVWANKRLIADFQITGC